MPLASIKKHLFCLGCLLSLWGCSPCQFIVQTEYLSHENLASYHVGTPDPMLLDPPIGQRLTVSWNLPKKFLSYEDLHFKATIRLRNRQEIVEKRCIVKKTDCWVYALMNDDYFDTGGILTYKVELFGDGELLDIWRHQLWTELIEIKQEE